MLTAPFGLRVFGDMTVRAWQQVGSGAGSYDIFFQENLETNTSSNFTSGQNASPDAAGTGTLGGALADEESSQISGDRSLKYTMNATSASSDNDFFLNDTDIALAVKQRGNFIGINFYYTYNGDDDDIRFFVLDQDDNELTQSDEYIKAASTATRFSTAVFIPSSDTALRYGFQVVTGNSSKVFIVDDIEFSTNPFVYKNLTEIQTYEITQANASLTNGNGELEFNLATATIADNGETLIVAEDDSANTRTKFIAQKPCYVSISADSRINTASRELAIAKNDTVIQSGDTMRTSADIANVAATGIYLNTGDYLTVGIASISTFGGSVSSYQSSVRIIAQAPAEHVVTPAKAGSESYSTDHITSNFWDSLSQTTNFDVSLVPLTNSKLVEWNDTTETRLVAKKDIIVNYSITGRQNAGSSIKALNNSGEYLSFEYAVSNTTWNTTQGEVSLNAGEYIYFERDSASSGGREGGVTINVRPKNAQFLAAVPMNYTQTKTLGTTSTSNQDLSDLQFNNLVVGKWYEITGEMRMSSDGGKQNTVEFRSASGGSGTLYLTQKFEGNESGAINDAVWMSPSKKFKAVSTTLYVRHNGADTLSSGSTVDLTELNYTKETTRFE